MKVEIQSYTLVDGYLTINAIDLDKVDNLTKSREKIGNLDFYQISFGFETKLQSNFKYVSDWLHRQKIIHQVKPKTFGEALHAVIGTVTDLNQKYRVYA